MKNASERDKNVTLDGNCVTFTGESNGSPLNFVDFRRGTHTRGMLSKAEKRVKLGRIDVR